MTHEPDRPDDSPSRQEDPPDALAIALRQARRVIALVVGATVIGFGTLLLFLPGPGLLGIAIGLGILATEFQWARRWLRRVRSSLPGGGPGDPADR